MYGRPMRAASFMGRSLPRRRNDATSIVTNTNIAIARAQLLLQGQQPLSVYGGHIVTPGVAALQAMGLLPSFAISGASPITPSLVPSRITGYAPLAIFFDASGATSTTPGVSLSSNGYEWRGVRHSMVYGDDTGETWPVTGISKNTDPLSGPLFAHVYKNPGTYFATVTSIDSAGVPAFATVQITVLDPAALTTYAISRTGNFIGAPAGSTPVTTTVLPTFQSNSRYFFDAADAASWGSATIVINDPLHDVHLGVYPPNGTKVTFNLVTIGQQTPLTTNFVREVVMQDLRSHKGFHTDHATRCLFLRCNGLNDANYAPTNQSGADYYHTQGTTAQKANYLNARDMFWVDCFLSSTTSETGLTGLNNGYTWYGNGTRLCFLGTHFRAASDGCMRIPAWDHGVMRHCKVDNSYTNATAHALKLVSCSTTNPYQDNWVASGGQNPQQFSYVNWWTSKCVLSNNYFGGGDDPSAGSNWIVGVAPQNTSYYEGLEFVIVENSLFDHYGFSASQWTNTPGRDIIYDGRQLTFRNNATVQGVAMEVGEAGRSQWLGDWGTTPIFFN